MGRILSSECEHSLETWKCYWFDFFRNEGTTDTFEVKQAY